MAVVTKTRTYSSGNTITADYYNADRDEVIAGVNSIVNAQVAENAAIDYSKLNLSNGVRNADIKSDAAIAVSKIATGLTGALVGTTDSQTLTNKTLTTPTLTKPTVQATVQNVASYSPSAAGTATLDLATANIHVISMPAGNITIAVSNATVGQYFIVEILQDGTGSRTVTWFSTIKWSGGSAPSLTTTANKKDSFCFRVTGTGTYDGYIVGLNV